MTNKIGIRLENKNKWETRAPLTPDDVKILINRHKFSVIVQSSPIRTFSDQSYQEIGAEVKSNLNDANVIFAIKELPLKVIEPEKIYLFFSHTIKGQRHNMPMLKRLLDLNATLIDYEKIIDEKGLRLIFFGNYAGMAGMNQTLWAFGRRVKAKMNLDNPFLSLKHTYEYENLEELRNAIKKVGNEIKLNGLPQELVPVIIGFAGYGNVSKGAQSILNFLPVIELDPTQLSDFYHLKKEEFSSKHLYKVVFKEEHMVKPKSGNFNLQDYYNYGLEKYESNFQQYISYLSILINAIYWSEKYPRLLTKEFAKDLFQSKKKVNLQVIGDISCDLEGAIELTVQITEPDNPVFIYNPISSQVKLGVEGEGIVIMAIDNLPCELPQESSANFSKTLMPFIPDIMKADFKKTFEELNLPPVIKSAIIAHQGKLTPSYEYLHKYLPSEK